MFGSSRYRCVAFDAVGTLIHATPSVAVAYHNIGKKYGCRLELHEINTRFQQVFGARQLAEKTSEEDEFRFWHSVVSEVIGEIDKAEACFEELYQHFEKPDSWSVMPTAEKTVGNLLDAGIHVVVASNFDSRLQTVLNGKPILRDIPVTVISSEIGWRKPSANFFKAVVEQSACLGSEILMVGDDLQNDVIAAIDAGLSALHYVPNAIRSNQKNSEQLRQIHSLDEVLTFFSE